MGSSMPLERDFGDTISYISVALHPEFELEIRKKPKAGAEIDSLCEVLRQCKERNVFIEV